RVKMPTSTASLRLRAFGLAVVLVATLASLATHGSQRPSLTSVNEVSIRQLASINLPVVVQTGTSVSISATNLGNVALPFGRQDYAFNFSTISKGLLIKRALGPQWQCLVTRGQRYITERIQPAFDGHSSHPTPHFTEDSFKDSGWRMRDPVYEPLPLHWLDAFKLIPEGANDEDSDREDEDISRVYMDQILPFTNAQGQGNTVGHLCDSDSLDILAIRILIGLISQPQALDITPCTFLNPVPSLRVPTHELQEQGVPADQIPNRNPPLHRKSDVLWAVWETIISAPGNLRYHAVEGITNDVAKPLMDDIFNARLGTIVVPWTARLTFNLDSQEGKALLASPNGVATAWFLIHRAADLGRRTPVVTIFNPNGNNRCMIWDLTPQGEPSVLGEPIIDG
ncbi:MAG: hypothetical protein Q9226_008226, partial [Calogaya cf. arnoldii]